MPADASRLALILPHRERFGAASVGGVGQVVRTVAVRSRFDVTVLGVEPPAPFPHIAFGKIRAPPRASSHAYLWAAGRAVRRLRPDLVEVHNRADLALHLARRFPTVLVLHNDPRCMRGARSAAGRDRVLRRLAGVVAVSDCVARAMLDGVARPAQRPVMIHNGIDLTALPPPAPREALILFVGRVTADKGADAFVEACAMVLPHLPGWRAEMIGADGFGPDSRETPFIAALRRRAHAVGVRMLGYRPHGEVLVAMTRAAMVVVPSRWTEPFGLTALEAMASGAALACSLRGGLAELAEGACRTIHPDRVDEMAGRLLDLARDPSERARLGEAGRARAALFDAQEAAAAYDRFRQVVLAQAGAVSLRPSGKTPSGRGFPASAW